MTDRPRVRFAPSPTGYLHVGGARTALFNWLFARRQGGTLILRIEDTDAERSSAEMIQGILDGLRWLGLDWDEGPDLGGPHGPYFQSRRLGRHRAMAEELVTAGRAYYCFCPPEALKEKRQAAEAQGGSWRYDGACRRLGPADVAERVAAGAARAIRFRVPEGRTRFDDLVHGAIEFDHVNLEDFVILRSDGQPTYHLSVVADDVDMRITHVVRGDDHISNTPKQALLYEAMDAPVPWFAHVPLILGPDRRRLSKRHGATSVMEYERQGFLPEAMVNFLALLGWSPGDDRELFTRDELVAAFSLQGITSSNAVFNAGKLEWFNAQHIMRLPADEIGRRLEPWLRAAGLWRDELAGGARPWFLRVVELLKPRARRLPEFVEQARPFLAERVEYDPAAVHRHLSDPAIGAHLAALGERLAPQDPFDAAALEPVVRGLAGERGVKAATLMQAVRVATTGRAASPGLFEVLELLGRERTIARLAEGGRLTAQP